MCMGLGCHAVGVVGCRIIDSKRERLIAMLTTALVPCNGRFPTLLALLSLLFVTFSGWLGTLFSALLMTGLIVCSAAATFGCSKLLSHTLLKGEPSSFTLELPPYRKPEFGKIFIRSVLDRTLFVLGRAIAIAAPAGLLLWILANVKIGENGLLNLVASALEPVGYLFGMDGVILLAFILALPANEIVIPIILMAYTATGSLTDYSEVAELKTVLEQNGWTTLTVVCTMIFMLFHFPCSTTVWTIKKESGSVRWALLAVGLPTVLGLGLCFAVATVVRWWI